MPFILVFISGLIITLAAVGGVEQSLTNLELLGSVSVAVLGLALMYLSTTFINRENYDA